MTRQMLLQSNSDQPWPGQNIPWLGTMGAVSNKMNVLPLEKNAYRSVLKKERKKNELFENKSVGTHCGLSDLWRGDCFMKIHFPFNSQTVCVEKNATLGGTCLNVGCIPSKVGTVFSSHLEGNWA